VLRKTLVLDDLFDPAQGWPYPARQVPVERHAARGGNPYYVLLVDGVEVAVFEQTEWEDKTTSSDIAASRLCVVVPTELVIDPVALLESNAGTHGLPGWSIDDDGDIALTHALPFAEGFPLEWLRKQLLVAIGLAVEALREVTFDIEEAEKARPARQWANAREVASVAGTFARAFLLSS
jgi:hypothetical protein